MALGSFAFAQPELELAKTGLEMRRRHDLFLEAVERGLLKVTDRTPGKDQLVFMLQAGISMNPEQLAAATSTTVPLSVAHEQGGVSKLELMAERARLDKLIEEGLQDNPETLLASFRAMTNVRQKLSFLKGEGIEMPTTSTGAELNRKYAEALGLDAA